MFARLSPLTQATAMLVAHAAILGLVGMVLVPREVEIPSHYSVPGGADAWDGAWSMFGFWLACISGLGLLVPVLARVHDRRTKRLGHPFWLVVAMALASAFLTGTVLQAAMVIDRGLIATVIVIPLYLAGLALVIRTLFSTSARPASPPRSPRR